MVDLCKKPTGKQVATEIVSIVEDLEKYVHVTPAPALLNLKLSVYM